jgi:tetratricopeptide (TPR) repeat protein
MHPAHLVLAILLQARAPAPSAPQPSPVPALGPTQAAAAEQLAQAEARIRTAIAIMPGIGGYHESLALVLEREGRFEEALASHAEAAKLNPNEFRNRAGYGLLLMKLGRTALAIPELQAASAINRSSVEVRKALGAALLDQGRREEAVVALREAQRLDSADTDVERSLKQAEATAPGKDRLNEATAVEDHPVGRAIRRALEWTFGIVLGLASLALLVPLLGGAVLALVRMPRNRREVAA